MNKSRNACPHYFKRLIFVQHPPHELGIEILCGVRYGHGGHAIFPEFYTTTITSTLLCKGKIRKLGKTQLTTVLVASWSLQVRLPKNCLACAHSAHLGCVQPYVHRQAAYAKNPQVLVNLPQ